MNPRSAPAGPWDVAILAGGQARRLEGRPKWALSLGGKTILERQLEATRPVASRTFVVAREAAPFRALGLEAVVDVMHGGALAGLYTALARAGTPTVIVLACDMPFVTTAFLRYLGTSCEGVDAVVPRTETGYHPLCAAYATACADAVRRRLETGRIKVIDAVAGLRMRVIEPEVVARFDADGALLTNVNTWEDLERARERTADT